MTDPLTEPSGRRGPGWRRTLANLRWASDAPRRCGTCARFDNDPARLERAFGNLAAMGSGFASVKDRDGLCRHRGIYLPAGETCSDHEARAEIQGPSAQRAGSILTARGTPET